MYHGSCLPCPVGTYNEQKGGEELESACAICPEKSSTDGKRGVSTILGCVCYKGLYSTNSSTGKTCLQCPKGAICPDKSCALSNASSLTCNETQDMLLGGLSEWDGVKWVDVSSRVQGSVPQPRQDAGYASIDGVMYLYGGLGSSGGYDSIAPFLCSSYCVR